METTRLLPRWAAASALVVGLVAGGYGIANAASGKSGARAGTTTTTTTAKPADRQHGDETPLTGDTLAKVTAAAEAKVPGGKVVRAESDAEGNAVYEVHMTNASGAPVTVYVDKSFAVVSVDTSSHGGDGPHGGGPGGPHGDETPLTGDTLSKATAAALAKVPGGKVVRAETDGGGNAAYEVHMTNASGAPVTVYLDKDFNVTSVDTSGH